MNRYVYARENLKLLIFIGLIVGLPLLALSIYIYTIIDLRPMGYCLLATFIIFFIILLAFSINHLKWRAWHNRMKNSGTKVSGKVVGFGYKYRRGNLRVNTPPTETFWLKVMYVDSQGNQKKYETPALSFRPEKREDITCDVYIYNNEVLVTNFVNLKKRKTDYQEIFYNIIIGFVFVGICVLVAWLKN